MKALLGVYLGSTLVAVLLTPWVIRLARRIGAVDQPGWRSVHKRPIPRIGGVAIYFSTVCLIGVILIFDDATGRTFRTMWRPLTTLLGSATFIFLIGLIDDFKGLRAKSKFLAELLAAGSLCLVGVRISAVTVADGLTLHLGGWGCALTLLWVVGITNAVNLSDGLDGLAAGVSAVTCGVTAVLAIRYGDGILAVLMLALAGSLCGFLVFNFNPAKIFMGDCGSLFVGYVIAASSVMCAAKTAALVGLTLPALALGIPIVDTLFSMLRRYLENRSLFAPDRGHLHHHLLDLGLRQRHVVLMIYLVTVCAGSLGLFMLVRDDLGSVAIFICLMLLIMLLFDMTGVVRLKEVPGRLRRKYAHAQQERRERSVFEHLQLGFRQASTASQRWQAVCEAVRQLELAWVSVQVTHRDGRIDTSMWRQPDTPDESERIVTMGLPPRCLADGRLLQFEIAARVNGSLESAHRRAGLFSRLIDESAAGDSPVCVEEICHDTLLPPLADGHRHHGGHRQHAADRSTQHELETPVHPPSR